MPRGAIPNAALAPVFPDNAGWFSTAAAVAAGGAPSSVSFVSGENVHPRISRRRFSARCWRRRRSSATRPRVSRSPNDEPEPLLPALAVLPALTRRVLVLGLDLLVLLPRRRAKLARAAPTSAASEPPEADAAFAALPAEQQQYLSGLTALHDGEQHYRGRYDGPDDADKVYPQAEHPVVRTHPVSGRPALFVNRIFTRRIVGLEAQESEQLLQTLFEHVQRPEFQCRFQWQVGSVAFWDNRCAQHQALWDYFPHRRRGWRVTIQGEVPYYRG